MTAFIAESPMRTRPRFAILIVVVLMAGAATGCEKKSSTGSQPAASATPIVIGSTLSLSGAFCGHRADPGWQLGHGAVRAAVLGT